MLRAFELYKVNELTSARKEWHYATRDWAPEQFIAGAKLAEAHGWYQQAIISMAKAQAWNDLNTRFPLAHEELFQQQADVSDIDVNLLTAIARRESAFASDAKSSAGALGLLQLLPSTGKKTARKLGLRVNRYDLLTPNYSIKLGAAYLSELLDEFNGNRLLACAAYNAGPHRVKKWLKRLENAVPSDVWIETIPYKETREYVQNVMTYAVIYGYRRGKQGSLIQAQEQSIGNATTKLL